MRPRRDEGTVRAELAEVERHLAAAPPHSGAGVREQLAVRRDALRRELADLRSPSRRNAAGRPGTTDGT